VNDIVTDVEKFYAFMTDQRETGAQVLDEPGWLRLGPYHAILWRHGEKGRPKVQPERREVIDDTALSQIMTNLHLLGAPAAEGGFDDEQLMRIMMLVARTGRRVSEIRMLDRDPLLPLDQLTPPSEQDAADGAFVARLRYQQTKIEQAPDTMLADAEIVAIIREQQQWADAYLAPRWVAGVTPKYLFLAYKMNRHADKPYVLERIHQRLAEFAQALDIRDSTGRLVDFNRTHRFRHTRATSLLNAGVPLHVVQRYMGHLSPAMTMEYAKTLASTHEAEFLRYRKITADGRDLAADPRDLYDMLELDKRADRILPNGWCLLPPRQSCEKGNACLTCEKFTTDASFLPELQAQRQGTEQLIADRQRAFRDRTGQPMSPGNIWLAGRIQEHDALGRIIVRIEQTRLADGSTRAVRGAGATARTDACAARAEETRDYAQ
jgi:integrase